MRAKNESIYVKLARETIKEYITSGKKLTPPKEILNELRDKKSGVFVSLKKFGNLRGCIGTFMPVRDNVCSEIIENAISAATADPRFSPVTVDELDDLSISVDILSSPEEVNDVDQLDPRKYGVIVSSGFKKGLLLPDLEGVDTAEYQIKIAKQKAGIFPGEKIKLLRFEVKRYH